jgi:hypothetical protein
MHQTWTAPGLLRLGQSPAGEIQAFWTRNTLFIAYASKRCSGATPIDERSRNLLGRNRCRFSQILRVQVKVGVNPFLKLVALGGGRSSSGFVLNPVQPREGCNSCSYFRERECVASQRSFPCSVRFVGLLGSSVLLMPPGFPVQREKPSPGCACQARMPTPSGSATR